MGNCDSCDNQINQNIVVGKVCVPENKFPINPLNKTENINLSKKRFKNNPLNRVENGNTSLTSLLYEKKPYSKDLIELIKIKLGMGADPNIPAICENGKILLSPLWLVCRNIHNEIGYEIAKLFISYGADVEPSYMYSTSALRVLLIRNHTSTCYKMVELLLQNGANPNLYLYNKTCLDIYLADHNGPDKDKIFTLLQKYSNEWQ